MLQFSLVFMLQERGPRQKTCLMTDIITFGVGNSTILNQDGKTKILSYVACFYSKCLAKIVFWQAASWLVCVCFRRNWSHGLIVINKPKILEIKAKIVLPVSATAGAVKNLQNATSSPGLFPQKMGGAIVVQNASSTVSGFSSDYN